MASKIGDKKPAKKVSSFWKKPEAVKADAGGERFMTFSFDAPDAFSVSVAGSFNQWVPGEWRLQRERTGLWKGLFSLKPGIYEYRFVVNGEWVDDPKAERTVVNVFGAKNAVLEIK